MERKMGNSCSHFCSFIFIPSLLKFFVVSPMTSNTPAWAFSP
jgi:hypothetical protein